MLVNTEGLIIREAEYGDNDKLLTVLTPELGKITVSAKGIKSMKNPNMQISHLLCYNDFVLNRRGDRYWLREAAQIENFYILQSDLPAYSLAQYFLELACEVCVEGQDESAMLRLLLNSLYMLAKKSKKQALVKAVFEMRCACEQGFMPDIAECSKCGTVSSEFMFFDIMNGVIKCRKCFGEPENPQIMQNLEYDGTARIVLQLSPAVTAALRYIITSRPERIFSFELPDNELNALETVCEKYILNHVERGFSTLDFYKDIKEIFNGNK